MNTSPQEQLISISQQIGSIAEKSNHYTEVLAKRISQTGKTIQNLTISELIEIDADYTKYCNDIYGGGE